MPPETGSAPDRVDMDTAHRASHARPDGWRQHLKTAGVGLMVGLSLVGGVAGLAGTAARHLPVCAGDSPVVSIQEMTPCVSADFSTNTDAAMRGLRGLFHQQDAVRDLASESNRVLRPATPRAENRDGQLSVVSWNLHHGTSTNGTGARPQLPTMNQEIKERNADVVLLQEVNPWDAQEIVDETGMVGYYSQTTPRQGNMILLGPEYHVTVNQRATLNHSVPRGDTEAASGVVNQTKGAEPRAAQALRIQGGDTEGPVTVFNTHLSTGSADEAAREAEGRALQAFVEKVADGGAVVGGGDLNTRAGERVVQEFENDGYRVEGARIDWLVSDGLELEQLESASVFTPSGQRVSDHPIVVGRYQG